MHGLTLCAEPAAMDGGVKQRAEGRSDLVHRVYADLRLSRGWGEPQTHDIPSLRLTALCGGVPGDAPQFVVPVHTQRSLCPDELEIILREASVVGSPSVVLAMQDDTSLLVYLTLSSAPMALPSTDVDSPPPALAPAPGASGSAPAPTLRLAALAS